MLNRFVIRSAAAALAVAATSLPASAHVGHDDAHGLVYGFMHPIGGADHMMAMLGVGMLSALMGRRALWLVPATFMAMMAAGAGLAMMQLELPFVELGISLSVIVLGVAVAMQLPLSLVAAMALAGVFATFHGFAHGAEMPVDTSGASYAAGFLAATALLHTAGIALYLGLSRIASARNAISRISGAAIAVAGVILATAG